MPRTVKVSREEELLKNAVQLFSKGGFRETSLQVIANELGITRPLFYYYFESKEDLLWRIIGHLGDTLLEQARPIAASDDTATVRLRRIVEKHLETLLDNIDAFRIYFAERHLLTGKRDLRIKRGELLYYELIAEVISAGQQEGELRSGDPHLLTRLSIGSANAVLRWYRAGGSWSTRETISATTDFILAAVAA